VYDLERPFHRLVHHFIKRLFHGAGDGDDLQFGIPALLGILSTPAAFGALALMDKYSGLRRIALRRPDFDVYRASISDEYFFIVYSMVITGAIVILKWDRLFPDRQDYDNLAVLPITARQVFLSNLTAILFLTTLFALDINWAACIFFPFAVTQKYDTFAAYSEFFVAHASSVVLSSFFVCFALLTMLGLTMLLVPQRFVRRASLFVRIGCALILVSILGTSFSVPLLLISNRPPEFLAYLPSVWFLDLHQALLDLGTPLTGTAVFSLQVTATALVSAILLYALTYRRHYTRIPEQSGIAAATGRDKPALVRRLLDRFVLRSAFQRATYPFVLKTLFRSERHCLLFGLGAGVGFFLAALAVSSSMNNPVRSGGMDSRLLSVPLILSYFVIISLRALFDIPIERNANWVFSSILDHRKHEARIVAVLVVMSLIVPWLVLIGLPLYILMLGWPAALFHIAYVLVCCFVFTELLFIRFRKIPFTCAHTASKDRVLVLVIASILGYSFFGPVNAILEADILRQPTRAPFVAFFFIAVLWGIRVYQRELHPADRILIFEERPAALIQLLELPKDQPNLKV
jgi:hypothetical protein